MRQIDGILLNGGLPIQLEALAVKIAADTLLVFDSAKLRVSLACLSLRQIDGILFDRGLPVQLEALAVNMAPDTQLHGCWVQSKQTVSQMGLSLQHHTLLPC